MLFAAIVSTFTLVCSVQILTAVFSDGTEPAPLECRKGILKLIAAVERARQAAAAESGGEREAIFRFRRALEPEWQWRPGLTARCADDRSALRALGEVDRLRYAEENAVRHEALDLAPRRRRVQALQKDLARFPEDG